MRLTDRSTLGAVRVGSGEVQDRETGQRHRCGGHRLRFHRHRPCRGAPPAGRTVHGILGSSPGTGREARRPAGRLARLRQPRRAAGRPARGGRPCHIAQPAPLPSGQGDPGGGPARGVREAPRGDVGRVGRARRGWRRQATGSRAVNYNIRFYPLNQHLHGAVARRAAGDIRLVTGRYFQDWLFLDTDWNWRLDPDQGGDAAGVRGHRDPLGGPGQLHHGLDT